ncbi:MAG: GSU2403 family nucleotidyltransferase fold protein [Gammaproteobacteria bacterium]|nr:GSU2403 family nucleotidyltransferase fold protein [Gammaproteobacteria bacterium]
MENLPLSTTTLFQQFVEQVTSDELSRDLGDLAGSFVSKEVKGKPYWYLQYHEAGKQKQVYLGPENDRVLKLVNNWDDIRTEAKLSQQRRQEMCAMLKAGGLLALDSAVGKVLSMLADSGIFRAGVVLVGTQAFRSYGNLLGVKLFGSAIQTHDIDLIQDLDVDVVLQSNIQIDFGDIIERTEMGFIPIPALNPKHPSTSFKIRRKEIKLDMLTPLIGKPESGPIKLHSLQTYAQPLRFLDFLIKEPIQTVLIDNAGILVNIPHPARYALHKCIISSRRPITQRAKSKKDIFQAEILFQVLLDIDRVSLLSAWKDLESFGKNWQSHAREGIDKISDKELLSKLAELLSF